MLTSATVTIALLQLASINIVRCWTFDFMMRGHCVWGLDETWCRTSTYKVGLQTQSPQASTRIYRCDEVVLIPILGERISTGCYLVKQWWGLFCSLADHTGMDKVLDLWMQLLLQPQLPLICRYTNGNVHYRCSILSRDQSRKTFSPSHHGTIFRMREKSAEIVGWIWGREGCNWVMILTAWEVVSLVMEHTKHFCKLQSHEETLVVVRGQISKHCKIPMMWRSSMIKYRASVLWVIYIWRWLTFLPSDSWWRLRFQVIIWMLSCLNGYLW